MFERKALIRTTARARAIDIQEKTVLLDDGDSISYGRPLIATGSSPLSLPVPGVACHGSDGKQILIDGELSVGEVARR